MQISLGSKTIPLKELSYNATIIGAMADITMILVYKSNAPTIQDCSFHFELDYDVVLHKLTVLAKDRTLLTKIMPIQKAEEALYKSKVKGNTAVFAKEGANNINIAVGTVGTDEEVKIEIGLLQLCGAQNQCWKIALPLKLKMNKKYVNQEVVPSHNVSISIKATSQISSIESSTHLVLPKYNSDHNEALIVMGKMVGPPTDGSNEPL